MTYNCKVGMSLIELVIVLAALMLLMLGGKQMFTGIQAIAARAELALLALTIRTEQQKALVTATEREIAFHADGSGYKTATNEHQFQRGVMFSAPPGALGPPGDPKKPIIKPVTFPQNRIVCYPQGTISAGTVYLGLPASQQYYAITSSVAHVAFLRLYQYRLNWIPL